MVAVKALGPQGINNWVQSLWRSLRQSWLILLCTKLKCISMSDSCLFVDGIYNISRDLKLHQLLAWKLVWCWLILLSSSCLALQWCLPCLCSPVLGWVFWDPWHFQEFVISGRGSSLAVIDKWESKNMLLMRQCSFSGWDQSDLTAHCGPPEKNSSTTH